MSPTPLPVDPRNPVARLILRVVRGDEAALDAAARALAAAEERIGFGLTAERQEGRLENEGAVDDATAQAFLGATSLVLSGEDLQQQLVCLDREGHERMFSFREWGAHVAVWANRVFGHSADAGSLAPQPCPCVRCRSGSERPFCYLDFYSARYLEGTTPAYDTWLASVLAVVRRKDALRGPPFRAG